MKLPKFHLWLLTSIAIIVPALALFQTESTSNHWKNNQISALQSAGDFPGRLVRELVGSTLIINPISAGFGCLFIALGAIALIWIAIYASTFSARGIGNAHQPYLRYGNPDIPFYRFDQHDLNLDSPPLSYDPPPNGWHLSPKELLLAAKVHNNMRRFEDLYPSS